MNHGHRSPGVVVRRFTPSPDGVGTKGTRPRATVNPSSAELGMRNAERPLRGKGLAQRRRDAEDEMKARRRGEREQSVVSNRQSAVRPLRGKRDRRFTT